VVGLLGGIDGSEGQQHEADTGVRHEVGLELGEIALRAPSKRREAVSDEITRAMRRFKLVYVGRSMSRERQQRSYRASLPSMIATSMCSSRVWHVNTVLYGSTMALATWGEGQTQKPTLDFLP
jgi:hypothetical protein